MSRWPRSDILPLKPLPSAAAGRFEVAPPVGTRHMSLSGTSVHPSLQARASHLRSASGRGAPSLASFVRAVSMLQRDWLTRSRLPQLINGLL